MGFSQLEQICGVDEGPVWFRDVTCCLLTLMLLFMLFSGGEKLNSLEFTDESFGNGKDVESSPSAIVWKQSISSSNR